jgi:hypothetical protein
MSYGGCIQRNIGSLEKGVCEKEFQALKSCFIKAVILKCPFFSPIFTRLTEPPPMSLGQGKEARRR